MKDEILALMTFPREMIRGNVPMETCDHAGNFATRHSDCRVCESRLECEWLYHNDELTALAQKPLQSLVDALQTAILYVDACVTRAGHDPKRCGCRACGWIARAEGACERAVSER
jgi:hypothetical protein